MATKLKTLADLNIGMGIKILTPEQAAHVDLGPLTNLIGVWT
jgi:hypothetical protein